MRRTDRSRKAFGTTVDMELLTRQCSTATGSGASLDSLDSLFEPLVRDDLLLDAMLLARPLVQFCQQGTEAVSRPYAQPPRYEYTPKNFCPTHKPSRAFPTAGGPFSFSVDLFGGAPRPAASWSHVWSICSAWSPAVWKY